MIYYMINSNIYFSNYTGLLYSAQKSDIIKYEAYNMEKINRLLEEHSQKVSIVMLRRSS